MKFNTDIPYGTTSDDVTRLQQYLIDNHYASFTQTSGYFGSKTKEAVSKFQSLHGIIPASGTFGPKTRTAIESIIPSKDSILCATALSLIGQDVTPLDEVPDEVACAVSVNAVFKKAFEIEIGGGASTAAMRAVLISDKRFQKITDFEPGCIVISATGLGHNPEMPNGHVGIVLDANRIASNNSSNGIWDVHYTVASWTQRYKMSGGYPVEFYKVL